jgi:hypothetical protein
LAFREVRVNELQEVPRCWMGGEELGAAAERAGWTARLRAGMWMWRPLRVWFAMVVSASSARLIGR